MIALVASVASTLVVWAPVTLVALLVAVTARAKYWQARKHIERAYRGR